MGQVLINPVDDVYTPRFNGSAQLIGHLHFGHSSYLPSSPTGPQWVASTPPAASEPKQENDSDTFSLSPQSTLSEPERKQLEELRQRDREVRAHEQAHAAAAGALARGGPSYDFERGPDGRMYAVGGEVSIDTSPVHGDPRATLEKAGQIRRAALAPADPSSQDRAVAAEAAAMAAQARVELAGEGAATEQSGESQHALNVERSKITCAVCGGEHAAAAHDAVMAYGAGPQGPAVAESARHLLDLTA